MPGGNNQGRYGEAEELFRPFLEVIKSALGEAHPHTLGTMSNLAAAVRGQGRYAEAEELQRGAFSPMPGSKKVCTRRSPPRHTCHHEQPGHGAFSSMPGGNEVCTSHHTCGEAHPSTLTSIDNLAYALQEQGRYREAEELFRPP
uniref:Kinesin light chain n=1 Tax=Ditylum brightwellii TaxID=49249 RepID=A0A6V2J188_9STRA